MSTTSNRNIELSIVVPVYGCAESLERLHGRVVSSLTHHVREWELILVNDGSADDAWGVIETLARLDDRVIGMDLSRNFGQHVAITAGLERANGAYVVVMDCDLQDRPEEIPRLLQVARSGYDVVLARRKNRQDRLIKRLFSRAFYSVLGAMTGQQYDSRVANFGCYSHAVIGAVLSMGDVARSFPLFVRWVGFPTTAVDVDHAPREAGSTTYTFRKSMALALSAMIAFSDRPLRTTVKVGLGISVVAGFIAIAYFVGALRGAYEVQGWATLVISIWLIGGINILIVGVVGIYVSRIFEQSKNRPLYLVRATTEDVGGGRP